MIDFLDDFSDSIYTDISKIFQDILGGWSFIDKENNFHINSNSNISVRMLNMRKKIIKEIKLIDKNKRAWQDILYILLMNYLRIIPYIKNDNLYTFIDNKLKETINLINEEKDNLKNIIKR